jgi:hypothetical protein
MAEIRLLLVTGSTRRLSTNNAALWAHAELRKVLRTIGARVRARTGHRNGAQGLRPGGRLLDRSHRESLSEIVPSLVDEAVECPPGLAA